MNKNWRTDYSYGNKDIRVSLCDVNGQMKDLWDKLSGDDGES